MDIMLTTTTLLMGALSALEAWVIAILYFLTVVLSVFLVVKQKEYSSLVKLFLGAIFIFIPFSGLIYLIINYKKVPSLVN